MNNSSANNVLLKTLHTSAPASVAQQRNYQVDQSSSFEQNFKEVQNSVHNERASAAKSSAKKVDNAASQKTEPASVQSRTTSKPVNPARHEDRPTKSDKHSASADATKQAAEPAAADQFADSATRGKAPGETKSAAKDTKQKDDETSESNSLIQAVAAERRADALNQGLSPNITAALAQDVALNPAQNSAENLMPSLTPNSDVESGVQISLGDFNSASDIAATSGVAGSAELLGAAMVGDDLSAAAAQQLVTEMNAATQTQSAALEPAQAELPQAAAQLPLSGVKSGSAAATTQQLDSDANTGPNGDLINPLTEEMPEVKVAHATSAHAGDESLKTATALEPKTAFQKAVQSLENPEVRAKDEGGTQSAPAPSAATASSPHTSDSLLKFGEASFPAARSFVVQTAVPVPVGQPHWSQAVGERVLWLAAQNVSSAEINLNPEHLGPMQVKVSVNQEQTSVSFTSHHAVVREVLDQNLGRLKDMFSEQGLNLVNVDVSDKSFSRQQGDPQDRKGSGANKDRSVDEELPAAVSMIHHQRLVDHYA